MLRTSMISVILLVLSLHAQSQEIDDVELGLEAAIAESEAALGEAEALEETRIEEEELFEKRKQQAQDRQQLANKKELDAKAEIAKLDKAIQQTTKERKHKEKLIQEAQAKIEKYDAALKTKKTETAVSQAKLDAATEAHKLELNKLQTIELQIRDLRTEIQKNRRLALERRKRYQMVKKQREFKERELASIKEKVEKTKQVKQRRSGQ